MSLMTTRARSLERQASMMSDGGRRMFTTSDSIDSIVAELLSGDKSSASSQVAGPPKASQEENILYEAVDSRPQIVCQNADDVSCENCKPYFSLLKSFILHLDTSHKNKSSRYNCELCTVEFDSALTLAMHSLLHVAGKSIPRDGGESNCSLSVPPEDCTSLATSAASEQFTSTSEGDQTARNSLIANVFEDVSVQPKAAPENVGPFTRQTRRRGRLERSVAQETVVESPTESIEKISSQIVTSQKDEVAQSQPQYVSLSSSLAACAASLLPALQERLNQVSQPQADMTPQYDVIRPRESINASVPNNEGIKRGVQFGGEGRKAYEETPKEPLVEPPTTIDLTAVPPECGSQVEITQEDHDADHHREVHISGSPQLLKAKSTGRKKRNARNQCIICLETFSSKDLLRSHRFSHGDRDKWTCPDCNREFSSHWKYQDHCIKVHKNKKPFKCDLCDKSLSSFTILATHKGLHSGTRPHECDLCGKRYLVAAGLKDHMIAHKNEREHRCFQCGAGFNAKGDLKKHMVTHMAEKPHCCPVCNIGFNRSASLRRHMRSHTGEKPFNCDLCEKAFSRKEKMMEHRRTHTGERPLVCNTCGKSFKDSSNFSNHKKIHLDGYVPRKRKRNGSGKPESINSVVIPQSQPITSTVVSDVQAGLAHLIAQKEASLPTTGKENTLKEFATLSTTIEDLQSVGHVVRHVLAANFDQLDLRSLINAQAAVAIPGGVFNLSADDVKSLQMIINGVQARTAAGSAENRPRTDEGSS